MGEQEKNIGVAQGSRFNNIQTTNKSREYSEDFFTCISKCSDPIQTNSKALRETWQARVPNGIIYTSSVFSRQMRFTNELWRRNLMHLQVPTA